MHVSATMALCGPSLAAINDGLDSEENTRRGSSNGVIIPFGRKSVDAEIIGNIRKKLAVEAEIVVRAFDLTKNGDGSSGPIGTKNIWLNERGYRSKNGSLFGTDTIHEMLTRKALTGVSSAKFCFLMQMSTRFCITLHSFQKVLEAVMAGAQSVAIRESWINFPAPSAGS